MENEDKSYKPTPGHVGGMGDNGPLFKVSIKMPRQEQKKKKVPVTTYNLGEKGYLMVAAMSTGYHIWGEIGKKHLEVQGKDLNVLYTEIANQLDNANRDYTIKAMNCEEVSLRMNEAIKSNENPLEKLARDLNGSIKERE